MIFTTAAVVSIGAAMVSITTSMVSVNTAMVSTTAAAAKDYGNASMVSITTAAPPHNRRHGAMVSIIATMVSNFFTHL